ncbi:MULTISPECIES: DUF1289 domain-containing protein [Pirellulaceae]|uniref:DUF1289 domain-containing protein n=1 Tax=Aporhodopirellula rubra TaxID=980271 RepID=A0A7W5E1A4_9BACT|nr:MULTISPECIES: DUF1289 domain-containing protein [Pirellulaceae]EMI43345.1 protein containing DUF1289 [Rhodopirellula sp. SWK7]MBB3207949.1 hypothetical protein [Aporhodopirellula rubra]
MTRSNEPLLPPRSPCIGICQVNDQQICGGCYRTLSEIGRWSIASTDEKRSILNCVQRRRFESVFPASCGQDET